MEQTFSEWLIEQLESFGDEPFSYSGKSMYGRQCVGVRVESIKDIFTLGLAFERDAVFDNFEYELQNVSWDNMAYDYVVYWENAGWPKGK